VKIQTEQDMDDFCEIAKGQGPFGIRTIAVPCNELACLRKNREMIQEGKIGEGSHLQQGIYELNYRFPDNQVNILETPRLYPSAKVLAEHPKLTGSITGVLVNCYDPESKRFLFHMRGKDIANPFGFQAAAAGMGVYGQHPSVTAALELQQEAGPKDFMQFPRNGLAIDILPFVKAGKIPQPLFSFGFLDDLSRFPVCKSLDNITEFEARTKERLGDGTIQPREAYHFAVPYEQVGGIVGGLDASNRFYGPVYDSTMNFVRALKDYHYLD